MTSTRSTSKKKPMDKSSGGSTSAADGTPAQDPFVATITLWEMNPLLLLELFQSILMRLCKALVSRMRMTDSTPRRNQRATRILPWSKWFLENHHHLSMMKTATFRLTHQVCQTMNLHTETPLSLVHLIRHSWWNWMKPAVGPQVASLIRMVSRLLEFVVKKVRTVSTMQNFG